MPTTTLTAVVRDGVSGRVGQQANDTYAHVHNNVSAWKVEDYLYAHQQNQGHWNNIVERFTVGWDTSSLVGNITAAKVRLHGLTYVMQTAGVSLVIVPNNGYSSPSETTDYHKMLSQTTNLGSITADDFSTTYLVAPGFIEINLNAAGLAAINRSGWTFFGFRLSSDIAAVSPADDKNELLGMDYNSPQGPPQLVVTWGLATVTTLPATDITCTTATLNGQLNSIVAGLTAACGFEWGETDAYEHGATSTTNLTAPGTFSQPITGLVAPTVYHCRAFAIVSGETMYGQDLTFRYDGPYLEIALNQSLFSDPDTATWTNITCDLRHESFKRGRMHELDRIEAGTAVFTLNNDHGHYWRDNTASPYYGTSGDFKPLTLIRLRDCYNGVLYPRFYGYIESIPPKWLSEGGFGSIIEISCVDMFKSLVRIPIDGPFDQQLSGTRIAGICNTVGWLNTNWLIHGGHVEVIAYNPATPADRQDALEMMQATAEAEGGLLWIRGDGVLVFEDNTTRQESPYNESQVTFSDDGAWSKYIEPELVDDDTFIYNEARIAGPGITEQIVQDTDAQDNQFVRALERKSSLIANAADAYEQAVVIVLRFVDSFLRVSTLTIMPDAAPTDLYPKVLALEISDRITFMLNSARNPAMISRDYHIEGIEEEWDAEGALVVKFQLWDVNQYRFFAAEHDGYLEKHDADYATAQAAADADSVFNDAGSFAVGQINVGNPDYYIERGYVEFPSPDFGVDDTIIGANLLVHVTGPFNIDHQFDIVLVDPDTVDNPLSQADYGTLLSKTTNLGSLTIPTPSITASWIMIPLNEDGIAALHKDAVNKFALRSSRDISATSPGVVVPPASAVEEYVTLDGVGSAYIPRLLIQLG